MFLWSWMYKHLPNKCFSTMTKAILRLSWFIPPRQGWRLQKRMSYLDGLTNIVVI